MDFFSSLFLMLCSSGSGERGSDGAVSNLKMQPAQLLVGISWWISEAKTFREAKTMQQYVWDEREMIIIKRIR